MYGKKMKHGGKSRILTYVVDFSIHFCRMSPSNSRTILPYSIIIIVDLVGNDPTTS